MYVYPLGNQSTSSYLIYLLNRPRFHNKYALTLDPTTPPFPKFPPSLSLLRLYEHLVSVCIIALCEDAVGSVEREYMHTPSSITQSPLPPPITAPSNTPFRFFLPIPFSFSFTLPPPPPFPLESLHIPSLAQCPSLASRLCTRFMSFAVAFL